MVIFDQDGNVLESADPEKGAIEYRTETVYYRYVIESEEVGHYEVVAEYPNGGKDVEWRVDSPEEGRWEVVDADGEPVEHFDGTVPEGLAKDEATPDIWTYGVYVPYTEDELAEIAEAEQAARTEAERSAQMRTAAVMMVRMQAPAMTDAQCLSVSLLFDDWREDTEYGEGEVYRHGGLIYRCKNAHTSQKGWEPGASTASLWTAITPDGPQEWQPGQSYDVDAEVTHDGKTWVSLVPDNVWEPGAPGTETVWREAEG